MTILAEGPTTGPGARGRVTGRTVTRRTNALNGRALGGGLLVAVAAVVVFGAWLGTTGTSGHPAVVVTQPLAAGTTLSAGDLTTARMHLPNETLAHAFTNPSMLVGRTLDGPLAAGELIQSSDLVANGQAPPLRPVALSVDSSDAGTLDVGDLVDVMVTDGTTSSSPTQVVLTGARVLSVSDVSDGLAGSDAGTVVTIGVASLDEVTAVVHAERTGTVNLVVGEPGDGNGLAPGFAAGATSPAAQGSTGGGT